MGALTYELDTQGGVVTDTVDLLALANETALVLKGADTETLQRLALLGGLTTRRPAQSTRVLRSGFCKHQHSTHDHRVRLVGQVSGHGRA